MNFISNQYCDINEEDSYGQDFLRGLTNQDSFSCDFEFDEVPEYENGIRTYGNTYNMISEEQNVNELCAEVVLNPSNFASVSCSGANTNLQYGQVSEMIPV